VLSGGPWRCCFSQHLDTTISSASLSWVGLMGLDLLPLRRPFLESCCKDGNKCLF
jgi:hypothetical protein